MPLYGNTVGQGGVVLDVIISGGTVVDGSGAPGFDADVGIGGDTIQVIGDLSRSQTRRIIDAAGMTVSPGFIDTHTHSEGALLVDPQHACGLRQGITTEVLGLDGMSYAPLSADNYLIYRRYLGGLLGDPPDDLDFSSVTAFRANYHEKVSINTSYLVPNGAIRLEALGFRDVPLAGDAMNKARQAIKEGIKQGVVGFSTGGAYYTDPGTYTSELIELCRVVRDAGGVYVCEPRRANAVRAYGGDGVSEALHVARETGVRLHLAHYRTSPETAGQIDKRMELIDQAKAEGVDCTLDIYPYPAGSSISVSVLPSYAQE